MPAYSGVGGDAPNPRMMDHPALSNKYVFCAGVCMFYVRC